MSGKKNDDWMFGDKGAPKAAPKKEQPDVTSQPTDRLEAIKPGEPMPKPAPPAPKPAPPPAKAAPPPAPKPAPPPVKSAPPPAPGSQDELKQKVLDHTAKLRRA